MAPEVIELKGASPASDIWSLGCTVIELLTGRPPYADIPNGLSGKRGSPNFSNSRSRFICIVMYRIVEDEMPPIPEEWSPTLKNFLTQCFQKEPSDRPSAEVLCDHDWLREQCDVHKILRPKDSIPFLRRVSTDLQKAEVARMLGAAGIHRSSSKDSDRIGLTKERSVSPEMQGLPASPGLNRLSNGPATPRSADTEQSYAREHSFIKTTFEKREFLPLNLRNKPDNLKFIITLL